MSAPAAFDPSRRFVTLELRLHQVGRSERIGTSDLFHPEDTVSSRSGHGCSDGFVDTRDPEPPPSVDRPQMREHDPLGIFGRRAMKWRTWEVRAVGQVHAVGVERASAIGLYSDHVALRSWRGFTAPVDDLDPENEDLAGSGAHGPTNLPGA